MGEFDEREELILLDQGPENVLCFDCEGEANLEVPGFFDHWWNGDQFAFGGVVWTAYVDGLWVHLLKPVDLAHMSAHMRKCLSSSTYLNKQAEKAADLIVSLQNEGGQSAYNFGGQPGLEVRACLLDYEYLVIPKWVLGGGGLDTKNEY